MSNTPSDPNHINTKALEGFARAFDRVITGKYKLQIAEPQNVEPQASRMREFEQEVLKAVMGPVQAVPAIPIKLRPTRLRLWYTFALLRNIVVHFRDGIRLRKYNREWIKNNIH